MDFWDDASRLAAAVPLQDGKKAAYLFDEAYRLPAARIAALGLAVPALLREPGQVLADIRPGIRVLALRLSQNAGILEMPEADVVGGEREPGAIGFRHVLRDHAQHLG